jgi:hypothetical protein
VGKIHSVQAESTLRQCFAGQSFLLIVYAGQTVGRMALVPMEVLIYCGDYSVKILESILLMLSNIRLMHLW